MTTSIHSVAIADFCEDDTTVAVVASNDKDDEEETFYIQTTCNEYRSDLGCLILTENGEIDDFDDFDFDEIIKSAEKYLNRNTKIRHLNKKIEGETVLLIEMFGVFKLAIDNSSYINKDTSSYQVPYKFLVDEDYCCLKFDRREDALEFSDDFLENETE
jgi:hypothetical protein